MHDFLKFWALSFEAELDPNSDLFVSSSRFTLDSKKAGSRWKTNHRFLGFIGCKAGSVFWFFHVTNVSWSPVIFDLMNFSGLGCPILSNMVPTCLSCLQMPNSPYNRERKVHDTICENGRLSAWTKGNWPGPLIKFLTLNARRSHHRPAQIVAFNCQRKHPL